MFFGKYSCKKCMINPINNYNMNNVLEKDIYLDSSALGQATGMKFSDSDRVSGMKFSDSDKASGLKKSVPNVVFGMKISAAYGAGGLKSSAASKHSGFLFFRIACALVCPFSVSLFLSVRKTICCLG